MFSVVGVRKPPVGDRDLRQFGQVLDSHSSFTARDPQARPLGSPFLPRVKTGKTWVSSFMGAQKLDSEEAGAMGNR